jgi:SAM-dependent methyltransferase
MFRRITKPHEDHFDSIESVRHYADHMKRFSSMYNSFVKLIRRRDVGRTFLEFGSGTGITTSMVAATFPDSEITVIDRSPQMIEYSRTYLGSQGVSDRIRFLVGDIENPDMLEPLGRFDLIYSSLTVHELDDVRKTTMLLMNSLNDSGYLAYYDLRRVWWLYWTPSKEGFFESIRSAYQPNELRRMFVDLGLGDFEVRRVFPFLLFAAIRK